jgi:hypothetical protein
MSEDKFRLIKFEIAKANNKKYNAIIEDKKTKRKQTVPFGDVRYAQYRDDVPLKRYTRLNHNDRKRRENYLARHGKTMTKKFSASYFSAKYLWDANI